jgi:hypothetical protein
MSSILTHVFAPDLRIAVRHGVQDQYELVLLHRVLAPAQRRVLVRNDAPRGDRRRQPNRLPEDRFKNYC